MATLSGNPKGGQHDFPTHHICPDDGGFDLDLSADDFTDSDTLGSVTLANVPFFGIALLASIAISVASGSKVEDFAKIPTIPIWLLSAGIMSAGMVLGSSYLVPRIGISAFFVLVVSGQVIAGMIFSQFGLFGAPVSTISIGKVAGAMMVMSGAYLVTYK